MPLSNKILQRFGKVFLPINITVVLLESVKEDICKSSGKFPLKSCPVMNCNLLECNLRVRGILAAAAAAFAEETPGIISKGILFFSKALISSSSLEKIPESPDFSLTIFLPVFP